MDQSDIELEDDEDDEIVVADETEPVNHRKSNFKSNAVKPSIDLDLARPKPEFAFGTFFLSQIYSKKINS